MKIPACLLALILLGLACSPVSAGNPKPLRAHYVIFVADDFVVDVFLNGRMVPYSKRQLLMERFGATAERINVDVRAGDWLVFNVANDRMRWGGAYYFAAAGCLDPNHFGFTSDLASGDWSVCDTFADVDKFITDKNYFCNRAAQEVSRPWQEGNGRMREFAGDQWAGTPLWGASRNTWIKVIVR